MHDQGGTTCHLIDLATLIRTHLKAPSRSTFLQLCEELSACILEAGLDGLRYHPLGFLDLVLDEGSSHRTQLHFWIPGISRPQPHPALCHSHGFGLTSVVMCGRLQNKLYQVRVGGSGEFGCYEIGYKGSSSTASLVQSVEKVEVVSSTELTAGSVYKVEPDVFHSSETYGEFAVTAVHCDMTGRSNGYSVRASAPVDLAYRRQTCAAPVARAIERLACEALKGENHS